eukprot:TRINITY_DN6023_c0_g1_i1.p1 TRINITY_DN6023_c0_g1~~TRINITY_DN6023_c0_g1_i1.p1  ORF type:complete len:376 (+),score=97.83 TRINITY_DN6023_c0_g1_i1:70-1128(+)
MAAAAAVEPNSPLAPGVPAAQPGSTPAGGAAGTPAVDRDAVRQMATRMRDVVQSSAGGVIAQDKLWSRVGGRTAVAANALYELCATGQLQGVKDPGTGRAFIRMPRQQPARPAEAKSAGAAGGTVRQHKLTEEERLVYDAIARSERRGMWIKDLKLQLRSRVPADTAVTKATKRLERDGLIKQVRSVAARRRSLFLLAELEPHESVSGGTWYNDEQEFDADFVQAVSDAVLSYIRDHQSVSLEAVERHVLLQPQLCQRERALPPDKVKEIVDILVWDGKVLACGGEGSQRYYQVAVDLLPPRTGARLEAANVPCLGCPALAQCDSAGFGPVNPRDCVYLNQWLGLDAGQTEW